MKRLACLTLGVLLMAAGCAPAASPTATLATATATPPIEVTLMTHESFAVSDSVLAELEREHGIRLRVLASGDAGLMVNQAILARGAPLADVLFGVDNTFLSRALDAGIFEPYRSALLADVPTDLQLDSEARITPIDYGDVCLNYDRAAFGAGLPAPATLEELADERYRGMLVVPNPATSSPGLAFLLATVVHFGDGWPDYWRSLVRNDLRVTSGWSEAYYGHFSAASDGDRPIVLSYATSPAADVVFSDPPRDVPATGVIGAGCFRQVEFAGILAGTQHRAEAETVIDFMLGRTFQEDMPLNMYVFPANTTAELPDVFVDNAAQIGEPLTMPPTEIGARRERLIEEWTNVVLR
ncbi:thiamine ABC transporter substrate-binding protein [soil metagenome]